MLQFAGNLFEAYLKGTLVRGNAKRCAVGTILKSILGYEDARWWETMIAFAQGAETPEDVMYAEYLKKETGLSIHDLWLIDGAFEGARYEAGQKRPVTDDDLIVRLDRVISLLQEMEQEQKLTAIV